MEVNANTELNFRKFPKIKRLPEEEREQHQLGKNSLLDLIRAEKTVAITEKLDGANSGIEFFKQNGKIQYRIFSHNFYLDPVVNDLRGWYQHAKKLSCPN